MRRELILLLALSLAWGAVDQTYVHTVSRDGSSVMEKESELTIFATELDEEDFQRMKAVCESGSRVQCSVDVEEKTVSITEEFAAGGYYTYSTNYGFPFITYTMVVDKIPNDRFSSSLSRLLVEANVTDPSMGGGSVNPIDFEDAVNNREVARILRGIGANLTYIVNFPVPVSEASAGNVSGSISGNSVTFDLISLLEASEPVSIKSSELNLGYFVIIAGVLVVAGLAFSFFWSKPLKGPRKKKP